MVFVYALHVFLFILAMTFTSAIDVFLQDVDMHSRKSALVSHRGYIIVGIDDECTLRCYLKLYSTEFALT